MPQKPSSQKKPQDEKKSQSKDVEDEDFKYIVRIANVDLDGARPAFLALTKIKGVGRRMALNILKDTEIDVYSRIGDLSDEEIDLIKEELETIGSNMPVWMLNRRGDYDTGEDIHYLSTDLDLTLRDDINRMKKIRCYRGIRHETGQKVRGQRTKANGRSGLVMGVSKKR